MASRMDQLRDIFDAVSTESTFVERQQTGHGRLRSERAIDEALCDLVAEMRARYRFRTSLTDEQLVRVVRGFYGGESDTDIARALGDASLAAVVARARVNLHLFRTRDADVERLRAVARLLDDGASATATAAALGVNESTVRRDRRLLSARRDAVRVHHRYQTEFESLLGDATPSISADLRRMRGVLDEARE